MIKSFEPVYDGSCKILILGSCPSVQSLQKGEYYGNRQNRFWRIMFRLLDEPYTDDFFQKKQMLLKHGIGLWDTIGLCRREGSLDSSITDAVPNDIAGLIDGGSVRCIALNGGKAQAMFRQKIDGAEILKLPSTSPANARMGFDALFEKWSVLKKFL